MKANFLLIPASSLLIAISSCKSKSQKDAQDYMDKINKTVKENSPATSESEQKTNKGPFSIPQGLEKIVGEWELVKVFTDKNSNHQVDEGEDTGVPTQMKDFLRLNANGTCEYTIAKLEGHYKIETKEDGKKRLTMYDQTGSETTSGRYIISVSDDELVINRMYGGSDFEIFKRI